MKIIKEDFRVGTKSRNQMIDITSQIRSLVEQSGVTNGDVMVYCPHTTAAITINENADPSVLHDILLTLEQLLPQNRSGYHHFEGNSDSHCKSSLIGCSEQIMIEDKSLWCSVPGRESFSVSSTGREAGTYTSKSVVNKGS